MPLRTVLDSSDISRAIKRISHEILEANSGSEDLVLLGIPTRGVELAERIDASLAEIDPGYVSNLGVLDITMYRDDSLDAEREIHPTQIPTSGIDDKVVVLIDDVLYSGRTVRSALDALIDIGSPAFNAFQFNGRCAAVDRSDISCLISSEKRPTAGRNSSDVPS